MSIVKVFFSSTIPEAPLGYVNGTWQADGFGGYSVCVPYSPGFENPMLDSGDMIYEDPSLGPARLPIGSSGYVLTVVDGLPAWAPAEAWNIVSKTTTYSASNLDEVWCSGTFTVTLPTSTAGNRVRIVNRGTGAITASPQSGTINGNATMVLAAQYTSIELACDGTNWSVE